MEVLCRARFVRTESPTLWCYLCRLQPTILAASVMPAPFGISLVYQVMKIDRAVLSTR